jgi:hypothetical protein
MNPQLLDPPHWPDGPPICIVANLPAFPTLAASREFNDAHGHLPVLARWECKACGGWHHFTAGARPDTNGNSKSGAMDVPPRIAKLALGWG